MTEPTDDPALDELLTLLVERTRAPQVDGRPMPLEAQRSRYRAGDAALKQRVIRLLEKMPLEGVERDRVVRLIFTLGGPILVGLQALFARQLGSDHLMRQVVDLFVLPPRMLLVKHVGHPTLGRHWRQRLAGPDGSYPGLERAIEALLTDGFKRHSHAHGNPRTALADLRPTVLELARHKPLRQAAGRAIGKLEQEGRWSLVTELQPLIQAPE